VIDYHTFHQIHHLHKVEHLNQAQIAAELQLDEGTVSKWLNIEQYRPCQMPKRPSKLDAYKGTIIRMLERHPYSCAQLLPRLKEQGYTGGYSILKAFVQHVRPAPSPAFLTLQFAPGECAQVDWGQAGAVSVGSTRRRLSFFVMVLCHSRMLYVQFTLAETMEHFLAAHQHAFEFFHGVPQQVMVDNCKVAVLTHRRGEPAVINPRYLDFANHYGFKVRACGVRKGNEKGRVEEGPTVSEVKGDQGLY